METLKSHSLGSNQLCFVTIIKLLNSIAPEIFHYYVCKVTVAIKSDNACKMPNIKT